MFPHPLITTVMPKMRTDARAKTLETLEAQDLCALHLGGLVCFGSPDPVLTGRRLTHLGELAQVYLTRSGITVSYEPLFPTRPTGDRLVEVELTAYETVYLLQDHQARTVTLLDLIALTDGADNRPDRTDGADKA